MRTRIDRHSALKALANDRLKSGIFSIVELREDGFEGKTDFDVLLDRMEYLYAGAHNSFLGELVEFATGKACIVEGEPARRFKCHCCDMLSLTDNEGYDICPWCDWEDVGPISPTVVGSPNKTTIEKVRQQLQHDARDQDFHRWQRATPPKSNA